MFEKRVSLKIVAGNQLIQGSGLKVVIKKGTKPSTLEFWVPPKSSNEYAVTDISWEEKSQRSVGKAAAGAIVGGVLTGGIGALVGAAIGGRSRDSSTAVITMQDQESKEHKLYVKCNPKEYEALISLL